SAALVYHFGHAVRHTRISTRLEQRAHRVVVGGLVVVGCSTIAVDAVRLILGLEGGRSVVGIILAAASLAVLGALSFRQCSIAGRVSSAALRADGHLSAVGAALAAITLAGTAAHQLLGWGWTDATAAIIAGGIAVLIGVQSARAARNLSSRCAAGPD